jgi:acetolactate synthase I/III small subunit
MRHIIAILLQNESGALSRVAGLFSSRGYNIESLSVSTTDDPTVSRITLVTTGSDAVMLQIVAQLNKLIDVVSVDDMTTGDHLERELALVKLRIDRADRERILERAQAANVRVLNNEPECFVIELTASEAVIQQHIQELSRDAEILEVVRSGALGISRRAPNFRVVAAS